MLIKLKVKAKVLAYESRVIRREEAYAKGRGDKDLLQSLYLHRVNDVRRAARATHLARAYIRGRTYKSVENSRRHGFESGVLANTLYMIHRYGGSEKGNATMDTLKAWIEA